ncbi:MAG: DNA recombination protein RmuC [Bacteroidetes bacterium]|nr:DNA recombination protein RmuC [Bacteroidota bacterium]
MLYYILFLIIGVALGAAIGYFAFGKSSDNSAQLVSEERFRAAEAMAEEKLRAAQSVSDEKLRAAESVHAGLRRDIDAIRAETTQERSKSEALQIKLASLQSENSNLVDKLAEQKTQIEDLQARFTKEFENLANKILDDKSRKFTEQNETQLRNILDPLRDRIQNFEKRVNDTHNESEKERSALREQLRIMADMNKRMSEEALNLTRALKGDTKKQGNWGELILEKVLERSGLTKGREYDVQQSFTLEDGSRLQPDVIVRLPDGKNIIVDSKVSLIAYERYTSALDDDTLTHELQLKEHIASLRSHVKGLSGKNYQNLYNIGSPDFVLLFVPIESAFSLAISHDSELYNDAFDKNVILVSPTTLLATLRTISNVWKQEYQNQNALEIARQGGDLYDKFVGFVEDLIKVGKLMDDSKKAYGEAMNKLYDGKGNLVRRAENMKKLGVKATKQLPQGLIDRAIEE